MIKRFTWSRAVCLVLSLAIVGTTAFTLIICTRVHRVYPPDSDEAVHLMEGLRPFLDARAGDWGRFLGHLYLQPWYPPLHSVMLAAAFAIQTPSLTTARLTSVALWVLSLPLMVLVVHSLSGKREAVADLVTVLIGATAPAPFLMASLCMVEALEMVLASVFLVLYIRTLGQDDPLQTKAQLWSGLALAVVFLGRIPMAVFLATALLVNEFLGWWYEGHDGPIAARLATLLGPMVLVAMLWLVHPVKLRGFLEYLRASSPRFRLLSWANLTHYFGVLADAYILARPWAVWMFLSIAMSFGQWRDGAVRVVLLLFMVTLIALIAKRQTSSRFAISAGLAALVLTGHQATRLFHFLRDAEGWLRGLVVALAALTILIGIRPLHRRVATLPLTLKVNYETDPRLSDLYDWVGDRVPSEERRIVLVNGWDQCSGAALEWSLSTGDESLPRGSGIVFVEQFDLADPTEEELDRFLRLLEEQDVRYVLHLDGGPVTHAGAWWAYKATVENRMAEVTDKSFTVRLWDGRVMNRLMHNQLAPTQVDAVQRDQRYPMLIQATLFELLSEPRAVGGRFDSVRLPEAP